MNEPASLRPSWLDADYWRDTHTATLHQLIDSVQVISVPRQALFLLSIRDELHRRGVSVDPLPAHLGAHDDDPCLLSCPRCDEASAGAEVTT